MSEEKAGVKPAVRIEQVSFRYDASGQNVLSDVSLEIRGGELFTILGPSGCGKTTLLRILGGLLTPLEGVVKAGDRDITGLSPEKRNMGIVFQNYALFPNMTVSENIAYGLRVRRLPKAEIRQRCERYMELEGLTEYADRRVHELSGGQQQRVAIARALVIEPQLLLMDEPMSNLDMGLRIRMREELRRVQQQTGITTLFITHDQNEAMAISDRIGVMRDGKILQVGSPGKVYNSPADAFVADFMGVSNHLSKEEVLALGLDPAKCPSSGGTYFVRPERLMLSDQNGIRARVLQARFCGMYCEYSLEADGKLLHAAQMNLGASPRREGETVRVTAASAAASEGSLSGGREAAR